MLERNGICLGSSLALVLIWNVVPFGFVLNIVSLDDFGRGSCNDLGVATIPAGVTTARGGGHRTT